MTLTAATLTALGFALAYVNGANDVSKGIATLVGSGLSNYRGAILWGTLWTAIGGLLGSVLATAMVSTFGHGLLAPSTTQTLSAGVATLLGAAAWVLIATRTGLPVSTTHAIVGSLVGVAAVAYGVDGVRWSALGAKVVLPLLLTPLLSLALVTLLLKSTRRFAGSAEAHLPDCLCAEVAPAASVPGGPGASVAPMYKMRLQIVASQCSGDLRSRLSLARSRGTDRPTEASPIPRASSRVREWRVRQLVEGPRLGQTGLVLPIGLGCSGRGCLRRLMSRWTMNGGCWRSVIAGSSRPTKSYALAEEAGTKTHHLTGSHGSKAPQVY